MLLTETSQDVRTVSFNRGRFFYAAVYINPEESYGVWTVYPDPNGTDVLTDNRMSDRIWTKI